MKAKSTRKEYRERCSIITMREIHRERYKRQRGKWNCGQITVLWLGNSLHLTSFVAECYKRKYVRKGKNPEFD